MHLKCVWSALETNLCVNGYCFTWLILNLVPWAFFPKEMGKSPGNEVVIVLSCHQNLKASKCRRAHSSKNETLLESALIQSKSRKLLIEVSIIWGRGIHSCRRGSEVRLSFASMTCFRRNLAQEDNLLHYSLTAWTKQTLKWKYSSAFEVALFHPFVRLSYLKRPSSIRTITACNGSAE